MHSGFLRSVLKQRLEFRKLSKLEVTQFFAGATSAQQTKLKELLVLMPNVRSLQLLPPSNFLKKKSMEEKRDKKWGYVYIYTGI